MMVLLMRFHLNSELANGFRVILIIPFCLRHKVYLAQAQYPSIFILIS